MFAAVSRGGRRASRARAVRRLRVSTQQSRAVSDTPPSPPESSSDELARRVGWLVPFTGLGRLDTPWAVAGRSVGRSRYYLARPARAGKLESLPAAQVTSLSADAS
jgi:hypothetical protein